MASCVPDKTLYEELLDCAKDPMAEYIDYRDIEGIFLGDEIAKRGDTCTFVDVVYTMISDKWPKDKCLNAFENIAKIEVYKIWALVIIKKLKNAQSAEDFTTPVEVNSISSTEFDQEVMCLCSPQKMVISQPELKKRAQSLTDTSKEYLAKHQKKKECIVYKYIAETEQIVIEKVLKTYLEHKEQFTENLALCALLLCAACREMVEKFNIELSKKSEVRLHEIVVEIEKIIENLAIDPSKVKSTIKSLLSLMKDVGTTVRELKSPWKDPIGNWQNYQNNVKVLSLFIPVLKKLIEIGIAIQEETSTEVVPMYRDYLTDMEEALKQYRSLPKVVYAAGGICSVLCIAAGIGIVFCGGPVAGGLLIVGGAALSVGTYLYGNNMTNNIESCDSAGKQEYDETVGISVFSTISKKLEPKTA